MDPFKRAQSFNEQDYNQYATPKPTLNYSQSFTYGSHSGDAFQDFSAFKSTINQISKLDTIKEEYQGISSSFS